MDVIRTVMDDPSLDPVEKVLFAILYCRRRGSECTMSAAEIVERIGVGLVAVRQAAGSLESRGFIKIKDGCEITDATSLLACTVTYRPALAETRQVPRP